ncbi:MAG: hypothetical protein ABL973_14835 [Micropepsaceae bacterium]
MLSILFALSLSVMLASVLKRPTMLWQKVLLVLAVITVLAVCVAWGIEYFLQGA